MTEGDLVEVAGLRFEVFDVPGHSPGHVVFVFRGPPCLVFGGDVLFRDGVGRTDFPGGDARLLSTASAGSCSRCRTTRSFIPATGRSPPSGGNGGRTRL